MKAMTIRLDEDSYKEIKKYLIDKNKSFQEYVVELIKNDLNKKKEPNRND